MRGVNWAPDSCEEEDDYDVGQIVRGDENLAAVGGEGMIGMFESEVRFVADSFVATPRCRTPNWPELHEIAFETPRRRIRGSVLANNSR